MFDITVWMDACNSDKNRECEDDYQCAHYDNNRQHCIQQNRNLHWLHDNCTRIQAGRRCGRVWGNNYSESVWIEMGEQNGHSERALQSKAKSPKIMRVLAPNWTNDRESEKIHLNGIVESICHNSMTYRWCIIASESENLSPVSYPLSLPFSYFVHATRTDPPVLHARGIEDTKHSVPIIKHPPQNSQKSAIDHGKIRDCKTNQQRT